METLKTNRDETIISPFDFSSGGENQLLFFFKPECFRHGYTSLTRNMFDMVFRKFTDFDVRVQGMLLLSGARLEELSIVDRHYGFINKLSREASRIITEEERARMFESLDVRNPGSFVILGGHEFLKQYPDFDEKSLNDCWQSKKSLKLRSGFYYQRYNINGQDFILVNGFNPIQIRRYTHPLQRILVLMVHSDTQWTLLKNDFAGDTYPDRSKPISIRGEFFKNHLHYGVHVVDISFNCVHLSAGPFEALIEIDNFLKNIKDVHFDLRETNVSRFLRKMDLPPQTLSHIISNPRASVNGTETDLFTCTEEKNTSDALKIYAQYFRA